MSCPLKVMFAPVYVAVPLAACRVRRFALEARWNEPPVESVTDLVSLMFTVTAPALPSRLSVPFVEMARSSKVTLCVPSVSTVDAPVTVTLPRSRPVAASDCAPPRENVTAPDALLVKVPATVFVAPLSVIAPAPCVKVPAVCEKLPATPIVPSP